MESLLGRKYLYKNEEVVVFAYDPNDDLCAITREYGMPLDAFYSNPINKYISYLNRKEVTGNRYWWVGVSELEPIGDKPNKKILKIELTDGTIVTGREVRENSCDIILGNMLTDLNRGELSFIKFGGMLIRVEAIKRVYCE